MYKPLADSTLQHMKKTEIIELLRIAEHNAKVAQEYVDQQAKNMKDWKPAVHGSWGHLGGDEWWCSVCVDLSLLRKVVGTSLPKNTVRIVARRWTEVLTDEK